MGGSKSLPESTGSNLSMGVRAVDKARRAAGVSAGGGDEHSATTPNVAMSGPSSAHGHHPRRCGACYFLGDSAHGGEKKGAQEARCGCVLHSGAEGRIYHLA
ncbi:hypothetical protein E2562_032061 [Oryza meyeriana var. granulata]|uniref:Uncharacterized protein n=1 Tax=Oryza meyeriana var. granulata TaxID=110450 RepID=A0A6G1CLE5_9ORYZ|nr:hypothetical protein E2562_032061 [Oryza meyeriana var. granulata]